MVKLSLEAGSKPFGAEIENYLDDFIIKLLQRHEVLLNASKNKFDKDLGDAKNKVDQLITLQFNKLTMNGSPQNMHGTTAKNSKSLRKTNKKTNSKTGRSMSGTEEIMLNDEKLTFFTDKLSSTKGSPQARQLGGVINGIKKMANQKAPAAFLVQVEPAKIDRAKLLNQIKTVFSEFDKYLIKYEKSLDKNFDTLLASFEKHLLDILTIFVEAKSSEFKKSANRHQIERKLLSSDNVKPQRHLSEYSPDDLIVAISPIQDTSASIGSYLNKWIMLIIQNTSNLFQTNLVMCNNLMDIMLEYTRKKLTEELIKTMIDSE